MSFEMSLRMSVVPLWQGQPPTLVDERQGDKVDDTQGDRDDMDSDAERKHDDMPGDIPDGQP